MRIASTFFKPIEFEENSSQHFLFQNSAHLERFRNVINRFCHHEEMLEGDYTYIDTGFDHIKAKDFHLLQVTGGDLYLLDERLWQQKIFQQLVNQIEIDHIEKYEKLKHSIESQLDGLIVDVDGFQLHLELEQFELTQLQKVLNVEIKESGKPLQGFARFQYLISLWLSLAKGKKAILIYHFPENDMSIDTYLKWRLYLEQLPCTVITITKSKEWLMHFQVEQVHMIQEKRERIDLETYKEELILLGDSRNQYALNDDELTISLAYEEHIHSNPLLAKKLQRFIASSKF